MLKRDVERQIRDGKLKGGDLFSFLINIVNGSNGFWCYEMVNLNNAKFSSSKYGGDIELVDTTGSGDWKIKD